MVNDVAGNMVDDVTLGIASGHSIEANAFVDNRGNSILVN